METALDLTGSPEEIQAILALARRHGDSVEASEPSSLEASRALNAGIDPASIAAVLTFVTLVFKTGTAALEFMKALREEIKARKATTLVVSDPASGKAIGKLAADSTDADLSRLVGAPPP